MSSEQLALNAAANKLAPAARNDGVGFLELTADRVTTGVVWDEKGVSTETPPAPTGGAGLVDAPGVGDASWLDIPLPPVDDSWWAGVEIPMPPVESAWQTEIEIPLPPVEGAWQERIDIPLPAIDAYREEEIHIPLPAEY